jgi:hypothetical protein
MLTGFYHYDKLPEIINLKEGKVYFGSQLKRVQSIDTWPCRFGPMMAQHIMAGVHSRGLFTYGGEAKRKEVKVLTSPSEAHLQ